MKQPLDPSGMYRLIVPIQSFGGMPDSAHYRIYQIEGGMAALRAMFPEGEANTMNFVLFSTSGVHGSYTTIEEIETSFAKYGASPEFGDDEDEEDEPEDYTPPELTVLIIQPRLVCIRYGVITITPGDLPFLKKLRQTSWDITGQIGAP